MVMAEWENEIMHASARALCEGQDEGFAVLNVGFGLGIIDEAIQKYRPGRHVIIEPHPDALRFLREQGWDVVAVARREDRLKALAEETGADYIVADLTDPTHTSVLGQMARIDGPASDTASGSVAPVNTAPHDSHQE